jgi:hypothetical protein
MFKNVAIATVALLAVLYAVQEFNATQNVGLGRCYAFAPGNAVPFTNAGSSKQVLTCNFTTPDASDPFAVTSVTGSATFNGDTVTSEGISETITTGEIVSVELEAGSKITI